jgi:error-prone DNA polymerase
VVARQRPENARGLCFITLHDEFGEADVVILPGLYERRRDVVRTAPLLVVAGWVDRSRGSLTLLAEDVGRLRVPVRIPESAVDQPGGRRPLDPAALRLVEPPGLAALAGVLAAHSFR